MNNAIAKLKADKASETDQILNRMLKMLRKTMTERLISIYQACIDVKYHSKSFREAKTIVLKKIKIKRLYFFQSLQMSVASFKY